VSPLKESALTLYLVGQQGSTGSYRLGCPILPRLLNAFFVIRSDFEERGGAGPPARYIGFSVGDLRRKVKSRLRYLLLDTQDAPPVDEAWDVPHARIKEEESQNLIIGTASPHLGGLPKVYFYSGRKLGGQIDFELLKSWMYHCEANHECYKFSEEALSQLRVINVYERCVVTPPPGCRYVALSYVWGSINISNTEAALPEKLPQTIEDAISAVKELGEWYLWVDALCIAQDDPDHKMAQIQNMDQICCNDVCAF
jgi:hypothetical protein